MRKLPAASLLALALSLGACADRSPEDAAATDADGTPGRADEPLEPGAPDASSGGTDTGPIFAPDTTTSDSGSDELPGNDPDAVGGAADDPIFDPDTTVPDSIGDDGLDPLFDSDTFGDGGLDPAPTPGTSSADPLVEPTDGPVPGTIDGTGTAALFPGRPDATRLYAAATRVLGATLLDLNARLSNGTLDGRQDDPGGEQRRECLGAFDPAFGEVLLAIDCARELATEPFALYVERGAFEDTGTCRSSIAAGTSDGCALAFASVIVPLRYVQGPDDRRPQPLPGSGVVIRHAIDEGVFELSRVADVPVPDFRCTLDIATGSTLVTSGGDCDALLRAAADHVDTLLDPPDAL